MFFNSGGFIMLKDEWLEYFEAVNGRKPRPIDFKEALERGEFVLSEGAEANQVADQGETSADQQFEEGTATARALAQSQKECDNAQEAMADSGQEREGLSQETVGQVRTIQSGRQAEDIQKEEEQRKRVAEAKERLASYAPTRPDVGNHSVNTSSEPNQSIPVFSNQAQHLGLSEDLTKLDYKEEKQLRRLLVKLLVIRKRLKN